MEENTLNSTNEDQAFDNFLANSEFLNPARIEQDTYVPNLASNFSNPAVYITDNTAGVSPSYYPSQVKKDYAQGSTDDEVDALFKKTMLKVNSMSDNSAYVQPYSFDPTPKGTFRDRYKAYGQETFNKLGFSPLVDNEGWYNKNTTFGDDLYRFFSHTAWPMVSKGFMDPIKSYQSIMSGQGLFAGDEEGARDYEYYMGLSQSTKGGLGGFTVNLLNSASYSFGILVEGAVEGTLIGAAVNATKGGNLATGAAAGGASFLKRLYQLPKSLVQATEATTKMMQSVKNYSKLAEAQNLFAKAGKSLATFANPLTNTRQALSSSENLNNLARSATTAGAFWHDMMAMNLALSEGKLEGGFTKFQTFDRLYNDFMADPKNNGMPPSLAEQERMMKEASKGSFINTLANSALIFYSNKLVFPSITKASFLRGVPKFGFGNVIADDIGAGVQIVFEPSKDIGKGVFSKRNVSLINAIKSLGKPATYGKVGLNYFKANLVEGVQETLQDVLQDATQNYFVENYKNPDATNFRYGLGLLGDAVKKQWSAQGLETFLSGFLMGSILQAPGAIKKYATVGYNDYFKNDGAAKQYKEEREEIADAVVNELNTLYKNGQYFFDPRVNFYSNVGLMGKVVDNPEEHTTKEIKDSEFATFQSAVISSLQRGTFDLFLKHYEGYKQASPKDIEEAWGLKPGEGQKALERFDKSLENAKEISMRWNTAKNKMQFMADLNKYEKDSLDYKMAEIYNSAYNQALFNYVFLNESFDNNIKRENKLYQRLASLSAIKNSNFSDFVGLTDSKRLATEIEMMKSEIENLESFGTSQSLEEAIRKKELLGLYTEFKEKQDAVNNKYLIKEKYQELAKKLQSENSNLTEEQIGTRIIDDLITQYNNDETNEFVEYKEAFNNLLLGLADTPQKRIQLEREIEGLGGIDVLFDDLLDTHILKKESKEIAKYVNLLSDPRDFYDHVVRNFKWMKKLYHDRTDIIKDLVNREIKNIEFNTLLNTLADQGIFIDLEEFNLWMLNPFYRPKEFIDVTKNIVIPENGLLYDKYYAIFLNAALITQDNPAGDPRGDAEKLNDIISEITEDRNRKIEIAKQKLDEALKEKYNSTEEELRRIATEIEERFKEGSQESSKNLEKYNALLDKLNTLSTSDINDVIKELDDLDILSEETLITSVNNLLNNPDVFEDIKELGAQVNEVNPGIELVTALQYGTQVLTIRPLLESLVEEASQETQLQEKPDYINVEETEEWAQYLNEIQEINDQYNESVEEARLDFIEEGGNPEAVTEYTTEDNFDNFPEDLQNELEASFQQFLINIKEPETLKQDNFQKYENLREKWLSYDDEAAEIISNYNKSLKDKAVKASAMALLPPVLSFGNVVIEPGTPLNNITDLYNDYEEALIKNELKVDNKIKKLTLDDIKNIKEDMKAIAKYIETVEKTYKLKPLAVEKIEIIERTIFNRQDELVVTTNEDGFQIRTFKDNPDGTRPERVTEVAERIDSELENKPPFIYNKLEDNTIQNLFETIVLNNKNFELEEKINSFLASLRTFKQFNSDKKTSEIKEALMLEPTIENLEKVISKYAFKESSDGGTYIDSLIRTFITPNPLGGFMEVKHDPSKMSKEAFDFLFHPVTGYISKFRRNIIDGEYQIYGENVKVFDRTSMDGKGITGELDLFLIDKNGRTAIVDIKAAGASTWENLGVPFVRSRKTKEEILDKTTGEKIPNKGNKKTYFRAQQTGYGNIVYNMSGVEVDNLLLLPLEMKVDMEGFITSVSKPTSNLSENNKVSENGMFIILDPLPEVENYGIKKVAPADASILPSVEQPTIVEGAIEETPKNKTSLQELLDEKVLYNGKTGKIVLNTDGTYSVEIEEDGKVNIIDLYVEGMPAKDGGINAIKAGVYPFRTKVEKPGQITTIKNETFDVKFLDEKETVAEINGIKYNVTRDNTGSIIGLSYKVNDVAILEVDEQIQDLTEQLTTLKNNKKGLKFGEGQRRNKALNDEITKLTYQVSVLEKKKRDLENKNKTRTLQGGNTNDYIFALNRLPNKFQSIVPSDQPNDQEIQIKLITSLSESEAITNVINNILSEHGMPEDVIDVLDGKIDNITSQKQQELVTWGNELKQKLEDYAFRLIDEGKSIRQVDNVIQTTAEFLNIITLIKFNKDGKISKISRKRVEKRTGVQPSTSVLPIQESAGAATEGVPRPNATDEELKKSIQEARQRIQGISLGSTSTQPTEGSNRDEIRTEVENFFDQSTDNLETTFVNAVLKFVFGQTEGAYSEIVDEVYNERLQNIENNTSLDNLSEGTILTNKEPVGTNKKLDQNFIVQKVDSNKKTYTLYSPDRQESFNFTEDEILEKFYRPSDQTKTTEEMIVTPQTKENVKATETNIADLSKDPDALDKIEEESENLTPEERMNKIKDIFNQC